MFSEVDSADVGIATEVVRRPGREHFAVLDDVGAIGHAKGFAHLVVGYQDADPFTAQIADNSLDIYYGQGVNSGKRLVQEDKGRF
jgi:hypothetical protein